VKLATVLFFAATPLCAAEAAQKRDAVEIREASFEENQVAGYRWQQWIELDGCAARYITQYETSAGWEPAHAYRFDLMQVMLPAGHRVKADPPGERFPYGDITVTARSNTAIKTTDWVFRGGEVKDLKSFGIILSGDDLENRVGHLLGLLTDYQQTWCAPTS
jgi:hypothetical protein